MAQPKRAYNPTPEKFSKSRAARATFLTGCTVLAFILLVYHFYCVVAAVISYEHGGLLKTLLISVGLFALNAFVIIKTLVFLETKLMTDIDEDHKKYI